MTAPPAGSEDFYCAEALTGRTPVVKIRETAEVLAFRHTRPSFETHIVVIPKRHIPSFLDLSIRPGELLALLDVVREVAAQVVSETGACRVQTNLGRYQDTQHLHWHVFSGDRVS